MKLTTEKISLTARYYQSNSFSITEKFLLTLQLPLGLTCRAILSKTLIWLRFIKARKLKNQLDSNIPAEWNLLNNEINKPLAVPYIMVVAPRWNPHALIATTRPIHLSGTVTLNTCQLNQSADVWCLVVYRLKDKAVKAVVSSTAVSPKKSTVNIDLAPSLYAISLRLYNPKEHVVLPQITGDHILLNEQTVNSKVVLNKLRSQIFKKESYLYYMLHLPMLFSLATTKDNKNLSKSYLPVGSPETLYIFGLLKGACSVIARIPNAIQGKCLIFLTIYNACSFPVTSTELLFGKDNKIRFSQPVGTFLLRVIPTKGLASDNLELLQSIEITIQENLHLDDGIGK